jgi:GDPmannose 4,6-dehydratase
LELRETNSGPLQTLQNHGRLGFDWQSMTTALITGINGQDGSYLAELLIRKRYRVMGTVRRYLDRRGNHDRLRSVPKDVEILESDLVENSSIDALLNRFRPDEVYNLAARASSSELWTDPISTGEVNALGVVGLLDAIHRVGNRIRFLQASSSEVFGNATEVPQRETTAISPRNPYGVAKAFAQWITAVYREQQGLFACTCILYNHESPRRGDEFVTRKISKGVAMIKLGLATELRIGDLDARRDWGFAGDYVEAMWLSLQQSAPDDYVVATGKTHSVREFCEIAFAHVGLKYQDYVIQDRENFRPAERAQLVGDAAKARRVLGWAPTVGFDELVVMMVDADLRLLETKTERCSSSTPLTELKATNDGVSSAERGTIDEDLD